jgi:hypothetical protein
VRDVLTKILPNPSPDDLLKPALIAFNFHRNLRYGAVSYQLSAVSLKKLMADG